VPGIHLLEQARYLGHGGTSTNTGPLEVSQSQQEDDYAGLEEDPEMYTNASVPFISHTTFPNQKGVVEASIKQAISSLPVANGANLTVKVVVVYNISGNMNL
jgi:hypothetical protein